jgi:hypothetical protein
MYLCMYVCKGRGSKNEKQEKFNQKSALPTNNDVGSGFKPLYVLGGVVSQRLSEYGSMFYTCREGGDIMYGVV